MLASRPLFTLRITLHPAYDLGATPHGSRRVIPVSGGDFAGERLRGSVMPHAGTTGCSRAPTARSSKTPGSRSRPMTVR